MKVKFILALLIMILFLSIMVYLSNLNSTSKITDNSNIITNNSLPTPQSTTKEEPIGFEKFMKDQSLILTAEDVQFDMVNNLDKYFGLDGYAELDDYYNYGFDDSLKKYLKSRTDNKEALFVSDRKPHGRLGKRSIEVIFNNLGKRAGITRPVCCHVQRNSFATNWILKGGDIAELSELMGHEQISTTQGYVRMDKDNIKQSYKRLVGLN
jgi:hypothetical protein